MITLIARFPAILGGAALAGAAGLVLAGCGSQSYTPSGPVFRTSGPRATAGSPIPGGWPPASPAMATPASASQTASQRALESERFTVAAQYWPVTSVVMQAVPGMEKQLGMRLRFEEAFGVFASCGTGSSNGLQYRIAVIIEASGQHQYEDLGAPLGQAARIVEQDLTARGWSPFQVTQGVTVAGEHDGISASFDNDPAATESENSFATALVYDLDGACVAVSGVAAGPPGGGSQAGGGPDAGPPPGDASAGDGLPPVRDSYDLGPAVVAPLP